MHAACSGNSDWYRVTGGWGRPEHWRLFRTLIQGHRHSQTVSDCASTKKHCRCCCRLLEIVSSNYHNGNNFVTFADVVCCLILAVTAGGGPDWRPLSTCDYSLWGPPPHTRTRRTSIRSRDATFSISKFFFRLFYYRCLVITDTQW